MPVHPDVAALLALQSDDAQVYAVERQLDELAPRLRALEAEQAREEQALQRARETLEREDQRVDRRIRRVDHRRDAELRKPLPPRRLVGVVRIRHDDGARRDGR